MLFLNFNCYYAVSPQVCKVAKVILDLQISKSVGREWQPISNEQLHLAVKDPHADAEMAYLETLLQDQAF